MEKEASGQKDVNVLKSFKVLSFDLVGTLIDFERGLLEYFHRNVPDSKVSDEAFLDTYREARTDKEASLFYPDDLVRAWGRVAETLGLPNTPELAEGFKNSVSQWPAFADSVEALSRLGRRFKLVGMTNTRRWAVGYFEKTLGRPFDDMVTADDAMCEKPDPLFFAFTRGRLSTKGYSLSDTLHVAQSQFHDIGVARQLGYTVCWIERRKGMKGFGATKAVAELTVPDFHYSTLAELADDVDLAFSK